MALILTTWVTAMRLMTGQDKGSQPVAKPQIDLFSHVEQREKYLIFSDTDLGCPFTVPFYASHNGNITE